MLKLKTNKPNLHIVDDNKIFKTSAEIKACSKKGEIIYDNFTSSFLENENTVNCPACNSTHMVYTEKQPIIKIDNYYCLECYTHFVHKE